MKMDKKNYPQVYLEEYKYKATMKKAVKFTDVELDSDYSGNSNNLDDSNSE